MEPGITLWKLLNHYKKEELHVEKALGVPTRLKAIPFKGAIWEKVALRGRHRHVHGVPQIIHFKVLKKTLSEISQPVADADIICQVDVQILHSWLTAVCAAVGAAVFAAVGTAVGAAVGAAVKASDVAADL